MDDPYLKIKAKTLELGLPPTSQTLFVSISKKKLFHYSFGSQVKVYDVSTSVKPSSCVENSFGTPTGLHQIERKIGHEAPPGTVFRGRVSVGKCYWELPVEEQQKGNLITSRILWLKGLEPGINSGPGVDTFNRYVYIHGTNNEERIGQPLSAGCVLLRNFEMIHLFDRIPLHSQVLIELD